MSKLLLALALLAAPALCRAQTITSSQTPLGTKLSVVACDAAVASRWSGWVYVGNFRNAAWKVNFTDADASAANLTVRCQSSTSSATANDGGEDLPVIMSTVTGASSIVRSSYVWTTTAGGAPGTSSFTLYISNLPAPFLNCLFTCGAGGVTADKITAALRGINP